MPEIQVDVAAGADDVWAVLVDVERWPEWTASMSRVERLDDGPLALGARVRIKQPRLPPVVWTVSAFEPGRAFSWTAESPGVTTVADHRVTPVAHDGAQVTLGIRRSGPLAPVVNVVFGAITRRYVAMEAEGLKRRCEAAT